MSGDTTAQTVEFQPPDASEVYSRPRKRNRRQIRDKSMASLSRQHAASGQRSERGPDPRPAQLAINQSTALCRSVCPTFPTSGKTEPPPDDHHRCRGAYHSPRGLTQTAGQEMVTGTRTRGTIKLPERASLTPWRRPRSVGNPPEDGLAESSPPISKSMPSVVSPKGLEPGTVGVLRRIPVFSRVPQGWWVDTKPVPVPVPDPVPGGCSFYPGVTRPVPASRAATLDKCSASRERGRRAVPTRRGHDVTARMARSKTEKLTPQGIYFIDYHTLITD